MIHIIVTANEDPQSEFQPGTHNVTGRNPREVMMSLKKPNCTWQLVVSEDAIDSEGLPWLIIDIAFHVLDAGAQGRNVFLNGERIPHDQDSVVQAIAGNTLVFGGVPRIVQDDADGLYLMPHGTEQRP